MEGKDLKIKEAAKELFDHLGLKDGDAVSLGIGKDYRGKQDSRYSDNHIHSAYISLDVRRTNEEMSEIAERLKDVIPGIKVTDAEQEDGVIAKIGLGSFVFIINAKKIQRPVKSFVPVVDGVIQLQ